MWKLTTESRRRQSAGRLHVDDLIVEQNRDAGNKWCTACKSWVSTTNFHRNCGKSGRLDGLDLACKTCRALQRQNRKLKSLSKMVYSLK